jgi:hypothetical protein
MKYQALAALVASTSAIQNFPPYHSFNVPIKVDDHNWPGSILPGTDLVVPVPSSPVDDDFDPMFNKFKYSNVQLNEDS